MYAALGLWVLFVFAVIGPLLDGGRVEDECVRVYGDGSAHERTASGEWVYREGPQAVRRLHGAELEMLESCGLGRGPGG